MKTVLIDARFWGPSHTGLGRYTQSLLKALYRLKPKINIALLALKSQKKILEAQFPRWQIIPVTAAHYTLAEQIAIPQVLNQIQPDLTHFLHFNVPLVYQRPFIVTIHDLIKHHSKGMTTTTHLPFVYPLKRLGYHLVVRHAVSRSRLILTPSSWVKNDIVRHYPIAKEKILVTPEAADQVFFNPPPVKIQTLLPETPYLIYSGNVYPHKNLIQLIKAIQEYHQQSERALKLVIVTSRDIFYQRLRRQIRQLNAQASVQIQDFTADADLAALYRQAVAFITASKFEGFGLPGLEAMAAGTLVLAAQRTSLPEVYGDHAIYFDPDNLKDIVTKILKAVNLPPQIRQSRIRLARAYARQFSWRKTAQLTLAAYEKVL